MVPVSLAIVPIRETKSCLSLLSLTIFFFSIPRIMTWCKVPGASNLACLGMAYLLEKLPLHYYIISPVSQGRPLLSLKRRVKDFTGRSWFASMEYRLEKLAEYLRGWMNYFGISEYYRVIPEIDHWLRRRVRMCYWKQWRRFRTRVRNLLKLGTHPGVAIPMCFSRKGPWRCARTLATQTGMTNEWLKDQGLLSAKELWVNIHYPTTVRLSL